MGGAYGHMMHLHEDLDLTFADLRDVIDRAATGTLERATEKTDGMNLVFTVVASTGELRVARSGGDIRKGGLGATELAGRFAGRTGDVVSAFQVGFDVLWHGMRAVPEDVLRAAFGPMGDVWYSAEVIDPRCPNVIWYDAECVVLHAHGSFQVVDDKIVSRVETPGLDLIAAHMDDIRAAVKHTGRSLLMPASMCPRLSFTATERARVGLSTIVSASGLSWNATLRDYAIDTLLKLHHDSPLPSTTVEALVHRLVGEHGALNLAQIKRAAGASWKGAIDDFTKQEGTMLIDALGPVEALVHQLGVDLLDGTRSTMVSDHDGELTRLRAAATHALIEVGEERTLRRHVAKLRGHRITSSLEGVVFRHVGRAYKLTGLFAPLNQVLGFRRYGRGVAIQS